MCFVALQHGFETDSTYTGETLIQEPSAYICVCVSAVLIYKESALVKPLREKKEERNGARELWEKNVHGQASFRTSISLAYVKQIERG